MSNPSSSSQLPLKRKYPTALDLRAKARRRLPKFAFEYLDGGAGADTGIARNWDAFDAIEMIPRYGNVVAPPPTDVELFGRAYRAPIGISPIGGPGTGFPGRRNISPQPHKPQTFRIRLAFSPRLRSRRRRSWRRMCSGFSYTGFPETNTGSAWTLSGAPKKQM